MRLRRTTATAAVLVWALTVPPAQAAPPDPAPPRPSLADILAVDPSTLVPRDRVAAQDVSAAAVACPPAPYGPRTAAPGTGRTVALTFDDGPGPETAAMMQVLEDAGVNATFFNLGVNTRVRPALVTAQRVNRFRLGNHTWSHPDMSSLSSGAQAGEMDRATAEQLAVAGTQPCVFRPPYGAYDSTTLSLARARRMSVWMWSVDTLDWEARGSDSQFWVDRIVARAMAGGSQTHPVVLMHNQPGGSPATLAALPRIITYYRDRGYAFVDLFGRQATRPVSGDWNGDGTDTPGAVVGDTWHLRNRNGAGPADVVLRFGRPSDQVVAGDWNGDGIDTPGVFRAGTWHLRTSNAASSTWQTVSYGRSGDRAVAGDWNGDGRDTPGVVRGSTWHLRDTNRPVSGGVSYGYGRRGDRPVTGDWNGDGTTTAGVVRGTTWYLRSNNAATSPGTGITYGGSLDRLVTGDWNGDRRTTPGVLRGREWRLRNLSTSGTAQTTFLFGP